MDLFMTLVADRVAADNVLRKVNALVDWGRVGRVLGPVRSKLGRAGYDVELMVRVLLLGQWHSLSDRALEHALRVRLDFMLFCGSSVLDHDQHGPAAGLGAERPASEGVCTAWALAHP